MILSVDFEIVFGGLCYDRVEYVLDTIKGFGIDTYELWNHRLHDIQKIKTAADERGMAISGISGNRDYNLLEKDDRKGLFAQLDENIDAVKQLGGSNLSILTECLCEEDLSVRPTKKPMGKVQKILAAMDGLAACAEYIEGKKITLNLETLNSIVDHAGYFMTDVDMAMDILREVNSPNLKWLCDVYHMQIMEGNILHQMEKYYDLIGMVHISDVPGRHEPGTGEINFRSIARYLESNDYKGYVTLECSPSDGNPGTAIKSFVEAFSV